MSKARAKGTSGEQFFKTHLIEVFGPQVERAPLKGTLDYGDFVGVPWLHESKSTTRPSFMEWARIATKKTKGGPWAILWKGDLRKGDGPYVVLPLEHYKTLVYHYDADLTRVDL